MNARNYRFSDFLLYVDDALMHLVSDQPAERSEVQRFREIPAAGAGAAASGTFAAELGKKRARISASDP